MLFQPQGGLLRPPLLHLTKLCISDTQLWCYLAVDTARESAYHTLNTLFLPANRSKNTSSVLSFTSLGPNSQSQPAGEALHLLGQHLAMATAEV